MNSLYSFIIKPLNERYDNIRKVNGSELIVNTRIEDHRFVSKKALVVAEPAAYKTVVKTGDIVYVHHNIFRRYYDMKGKEKNSSTFFKDDMYFCLPDQIYMYNNKCHLDYCFIKPISNTSNLSTSKEKPHFGILKYSNKRLEAVGLKPGDLIIFTPNSEFEFIIEDEKLYCMKCNDIALTYEHERNEKENNTSWSSSSS